MGSNGAHVIGSSPPNVKTEHVPTMVLLSLAFSLTLKAKMVDNGGSGH